MSTPLTARAALLEAWHIHLAQNRRRSPHTVRAYVATAARLLDALQLQDWPAVARLDAADLRRQLAARRADGIGNVSAARELSALKGFLAFARAKTGEANRAPPRLRGPRIKKGLPRPVTPDEAVHLMEMVAISPRTTGSARATAPSSSCSTAPACASPRPSRSPPPPCLSARRWSSPARAASSAWSRSSPSSAPAWPTMS